jgi:hypothetical protein
MFSDLCLQCTTDGHSIRCLESHCPDEHGSRQKKYTRLIGDWRKVTDYM